MKITIFGHSASGKSTLSLELSKIYNLPVFHIDNIVYRERFTEMPLQDEAITYRVCQIAKTPEWIIEGITTYKELELRANEADMVIFLDLNLANCFIRSIKRFFRNRGKQQLGGGDGCLEVYSLGTIINLLRTRSPKNRNLFRKISEANTHKIIILKSQKEIDSFLKKIS